MSEERRGISRWSWGGVRSGKKLQVLIICLLVSTFIWFTRELSKDAASSVEIEIELLGLPDSLIVVSSNVSSLEVALSSSGFELFGQQVKHIDPFQLHLKQAINSGRIEYSEVQLKALLQQHIGGEAKVVSLVPDRLIIEVDEKVERTVAVYPVLEVKTGKNFFISGLPQASPSSVNVIGPRSVLDTMQFVYTKPIRTKALEADKTVEISLDLPPIISSEISEVTVDLSVDQWTEKTLSVPISLPQVGQGLKMRTYPDSAKVTFQVGLKQFSTITSAQFRIDVVVKDESELKEAYKLPLRLNTQPSSIRNVSLSPSQVEFILLATGQNK